MRGRGLAVQGPLDGDRPVGGDAELPAAVGAAVDRVLDPDGERK